MAEFIRTEEKVFNVGEPVIFENNTDSDFSVSAAIVFRKSGLYDVSIVGRRIIISKVAERKKGRWIKMSDADGEYYACSVCGGELQRILLSKPTWDKPYPDMVNCDPTDFCPNCGADMRKEGDS